MNSGKLITPLKNLISRRLDSSVLLFIASLAAVLIANSPFSTVYQSFINYPIFVQIGNFELFSHHGQTMTLLSFVNDVLMVLFFLQVGLEIKQEGLVGELSSTRRAIFPVVGALGGMIVPVLVFFLFCHTEPASRGMAIPMATDIAFALAVLSSLGSRVPSALKTFLATLAVADDIGGIIVIALFYSTHLNLIMLLWAIGVLVVLYFLGQMGMRKVWLYYLGAFVVWYFFLQSGIHTTIAGVLVAFIISARPNIPTQNMIQVIKGMLGLFPEEEQKTAGKAVLLPHEQVAVVYSMNQTIRNSVNPIQRMETQLAPIVNFLILPLFAFVNAGVAFGDISAQQLLGIPLAISAGLFIGKPVGIFLFSILFIRLTKSSMPSGMTTKNLLALSCLGGIGFTVSLFIASLSYGATDHALLLNEAKIGIFVGSILSGAVGFVLLKRFLSSNTPLRISREE